ncbi:MAG: helix-turn-helix transcriptional regulator [Clostridia bacterium]|nr:helix-turn-helix transcriptional regulator [Clostridia bacterium]
MGCVTVNYRIIGLNVSIHRHAQNLTQEQLAEKSGVSKQFICNIECGRAIPSLNTVLSLCHALAVSPNDLLHHSAIHNPDAPCTLREDHSVFTDTLTDKLFPQEPQEIRIDPDDLPAFDIILHDLREVQEDPQE